MLEAQAFVTLQSFLEGFARIQYDATVSMTPLTDGGPTCLPKAVKYLLTNYAQDKDSKKVVQEFRDTKQKPEKAEKQFPAE